MGPDAEAAPHEDVRRARRATRLFQSPYEALLYPATLTQAENNPLSLHLLASI